MNSTHNDQYPNIGDTVIANEIPGASPYNDHQCRVTAIDRFSKMITGEFRSIQKPDDTISFTFQLWSPVAVEPDPYAGWDIDAYKTAIAGLNKRIEILVEEEERLTARVQNYQNDIATIGSLLLEEAERRDWCGEYDEFVQTVNEHLAVGVLPQREREYEITVTGTATVSWYTTVTVTARSEDEAIEVVESGSESFFDMDDEAENAVTYNGWDANEIEDVTCR